MFEKKTRLKRMKNYTKQKISVFDQNAISIIDSEIEFKASNSTWLTKENKKAKTKH